MRETMLEGTSGANKILPSVQKLFPQYRKCSHSTEIVPTVQKLFPQYRNYSRSTEIIPTVQKLSPQYRNCSPQYRNCSHSTEILPSVQKLFPQYRNYSHSTEIIPSVQKLFPQFDTRLFSLPDTRFEAMGRLSQIAPKLSQRTCGTYARRLLWARLQFWKKWGQEVSRPLAQFSCLKQWHFQPLSIKIVAFHVVFDTAGANFQSKLKLSLHAWSPQAVSFARPSQSKCNVFMSHLKPRTNIFSNLFNSLSIKTTTFKSCLRQRIIAFSTPPLQFQHF